MGTAPFALRQRISFSRAAFAASGPRQLMNEWTAEPADFLDTVATLRRMEARLLGIVLIGTPTARNSTAAPTAR